MDRIPKAIRARNGVTPAELKICDLCGSLNHETNKDCFTCGWRGQFGADAAMVELAWHRLHHQHEGVLLEHVTSRSTVALGDFGKPRHANCPQRIAFWLQAWWKNIAAARRPRTQAQAGTPQPASPKSDL